MLMHNTEMQMPIYFSSKPVVIHNKVLLEHKLKNKTHMPLKLDKNTTDSHAFFHLQHNTCDFSMVQSDSPKEFSTKFLKG